MATTNSTLDPFLPALGGLDQTSNGFLLWGAALVFIMTPGLGFFYSGMSRSKNALTMIMLCMAAMCVVSIQWVVIGFSLAFSEGKEAFSSGSVFIGDGAHFGLTGIGFDAFRIAPAVSAITFCIYQMQFATITAALIFGSVAERVRIIPALIFILCWTTVIYDPVAYWTWSWRGWIRNFSCISTGADGTAPCGTGGLDFAGGGPVHIASGFAGLAYCIVLGKRRRVGNEEFKPHNLANVFLGTALLWFGWFAFNGGSAVAGTARAAMAGAVTHIATATGALAWPDHRLCAVAALVAITPASGFVAPWAAIVIGAAAGIVCNFACRIKGFFGFDDSLDAWGVHGVGGFLGNVLTGFLAQRWIPTLDGTNSDALTIVPGGAVDGHWVQVGWQIAGSSAIAAYSFFGSLIILSIINFIPGLKLRVSEDDEILGGDLGEMGEVAYELVSSIVEPYAEKTSPKMEAAVVV
ncbi:ammonium transporter AmtB-like domain-containing protein [Zopfochytrium polystomum]|nr:ammonium transporter AmtB-like domain-containing protein [Zopfochytrium polystomum]